MGFYTEFILNYKNQTYVTCDRDGFEKYSDINIEKFVKTWSIFRNYVIDMLKFLNIDRSDERSPWPKWSIYDGGSYSGDNMFFIYIYSEQIRVQQNSNQSITIIDHDFIKNAKLEFKSEFKTFLNHRFHLNQIWKRNRISKDLSSWIEMNYF